MLRKVSTLHNLLCYAYSLCLTDQTQRFHWLIVQYMAVCFCFVQMVFRARTWIWVSTVYIADNFKWPHRLIDRPRDVIIINCYQELGVNNMIAFLINSHRSTPRLFSNPILQSCWKSLCQIFKTLPGEASYRRMCRFGIEGSPLHQRLSSWLPLLQRPWHEDVPGQAIAQSFDRIQDSTQHGLTIVVIAYA